MVNQNDQTKLLDYHLRQLTEDEAQAIVVRIEADPEFRAESRAIQRTLRLLNSFDVTVPAGLEGRVLAGIDKRLQPIRMAPESGMRSGFAGGLLSIRDLVAAAAMIAVAFGLFVPAFSRAREQGHRTLCQSNLRNVGMGMNAYAASFGGELPFADQKPGAYWLPVNQPGVPVQDNRRHAYLLIRQKMARPEDFVCPSRPDAIVMMADRPEAFETFPESRNTTYSLQCMAGVRPRITQFPNMPIMADQTPMFANGLFNWPGSRKVNSPNHAHDGQNILMMDGRVVWTSGPEAGIGADNIWLIQGRENDQYRGMEAPTAPTDAFLVP
jgi:hypothetical protein